VFISSHLQTFAAEKRFHSGEGFFEKVLACHSPAIPVLFRPHFQSVYQCAELLAAQIYLPTFTDRPGKPTAL
jgi:hypothetical protein